ncbi:tRNA 2-thiouridine(34) synthase MnmA [Dehalococcoidales bacterium]|nr:tRNA 2-thiouridine(34) synthase MnmA [Dehalococcoidales bacterium]
MKVVVAMSGGVDSSVAAAILKQQGYQVIGVTMQIWSSDKQAHEVDRFGGCCRLGAIDDARRVAYKLGIPHYVMDFRDVFNQKVVADFCREYSLGRTPNPCIRCNQYIKFDSLLERAKGLGANFVATGHYARIDKAKGRYLLKKGIDPSKDQSYVLYPLTQEQLGHTLLPIGNFTKQRVREIARELGLAVAAKPESQEICFIPDDDYPKFLKEHIPEAVKPGPILDEQGNILGKHRGILFYTIGQRKGLGISTKEPLYVTAIEQERNAIVVSSKEKLYGNGLIATGLNWIAIAKLKQAITVKAKIRYRHNEAEAKITPLDKEEVYVRFKQPQMAITPGQAIVFYHGDTVIGGGTIEKEEMTWLK